MGEDSQLTFTLKVGDLSVANAVGDKVLHAGDGYDIVFTDGHDVRVTAALATSGAGVLLVEPYPNGK